MSLLLEFFLDLWAAAWTADERLHGPSRRRWPWVVLAVGGCLVVVVWILELAGVL